MNSAQEIQCPGLNGGNPLHFLAAMGVFRLLNLHDSDSRMRWAFDGIPYPVYWTRLSESELFEALAGDFGWVAVEDEGTSDKSKKKSGKNTLRLSRLQTKIPVVFGHDIIKRPVSDFRELAEKSLLADEKSLPIQHEIIAAFGSDAAFEEDKKSKQSEVLWSRFSFSNGGSGKCLLKDFRGCALKVNKETMSRTLKGIGNKDDVTSLNWDPTSQRSYAFQHGDPGNKENKVPCDATANALAFIGLTLFPSMPEKQTLLTVGISSSGDSWSWPLWKTLVSLPVVRSILNARQKTLASFEERGDVVFRFLSKRFSVNKRFYFSPSVPKKGRER